MLHKYKDVIFVDEDEDPPEYREIVNLEWNAKKPRGWVMVGVPVGSCPWRQ